MMPGESLASRAVSSANRKRPPSRVWSGIKRGLGWFGACYLVVLGGVHGGAWLGLVDLRSKPSTTSAVIASAPVSAPVAAPPSADRQPGSLEVSIAKWSEARGEHLVTARRQMTWVRVTRAGLGETWPLTVDVAWVGCSRELPMFSVILVVDGVPWALNGSTKGWANGDRYRLELSGAWQTVRVSSTPETWWAEDPGLVLGGKVGRKNIQPLFAVADSIGCLLPASLKR